MGHADSIRSVAAKPRWNHVVYRVWMVGAGSQKDVWLTEANDGILTLVEMNPEYENSPQTSNWIKQWQDELQREIPTRVNVVQFNRAHHTSLCSSEGDEGRIALCLYDITERRLASLWRDREYREASAEDEFYARYANVPDFTSSTRGRARNRTSAHG